MTTRRYMFKIIEKTAKTESKDFCIEVWKLMKTFIFVAKQVS